MVDTEGIGNQGFSMRMAARIYEMLTDVFHEELEQVQRTARKRHLDMNMDEMVTVDEVARQFHTASSHS
jgi:hypothetical protein